MSNEELLKPRFKVIADYPKSVYKIDEIIECDDMITESMIGNPAYSLYPAIFKKLSWWEERKESDMPEYLKNKHHHRVYKVVKHFTSEGHYGLCFEHDGANKYYNRYLPATKEEFLNQSK